MAQTSFPEITAFNDNLKNALGEIPPFGLTNFPSVIELSANNVEVELGRVISESAGSILAVFGIDGNNNFTVSFVPLDSNKKIITTADGEENWPPPSVVNFPNGLNSYLPK